MATFTAQVLIGSSHPNHDGIIPTHALLVSENSRAALVLMPFGVHEGEVRADDATNPRRIVWIPHPAHVVDDLVLQVLVHVMREPAVSSGAEEIIPGLTTAEHVDLSELNAADRGTLSALCLGVAFIPKLVVTLLGGSLLTPNITRFGDYTMDIEICSVAYQRQYSGWSKKTHISGDLEGIQSL
ncbi:MAG: hypothetical protein EA383_07165 [Spirochaetaceae bacterium]|nr:MAG: hypothetical protein EA383_07165 [Spirochaetaceae bacterium]